LRYRFALFFHGKGAEIILCSLLRGYDQALKDGAPLILVAGLLVSRRNCFLPEQSSPDLTVS